MKVGIYVVLQLYELVNEAIWVDAKQ